MRLDPESLDSFLLKTLEKKSSPCSQIEDSLAAVKIGGMPGMKILHPPVGPGELERVEVVFRIIHCVKEYFKN